MKSVLYLALSFLYFSCIPIRIAPNIETDKVMMGKKFKRQLPKRNAFIFQDPKDANAFYNYINTKFELQHTDVESNVYFMIDEEAYYFSFYEVEIPTKTINLVPILIDAKRVQNDNYPLFENAYASRKNHWYLAITVSDDNFNDCLKSEHRKHKKILTFLRELKYEYLNTDNYLEVLFKK